LSGVNGLLLGKIRFEVDKVLPADLQEKFAKNASGEINTNNYEFFAGKIDGKDLELAANRVAQLLREAKPDNLALAEELDNNLKKLELAEQVMRVKQESLAITYAPKKKLDWRPREETGEQGELPNNRPETEALKSQKGNDYTADATLDQ
jgi:vancomycin resistance protein YoaR